MISVCNVRRIEGACPIEQLADDIPGAPCCNPSPCSPCWTPTAPSRVLRHPRRGRRHRALELLIKQHRLAKEVPIPCVIRPSGIAEEDNLAENVPLHPLHQFRAFLALRERGQSEEENAAAFFVSVVVLKQRLRLASVSPKLPGIYAEHGLTRDHVMAFTVTDDGSAISRSGEGGMAR